MTNKSSIQYESKPPLYLHFLINLLLTFALSLSLYILITNLLLLVHNISIQSLLETLKPIHDDARFINNLKIYNDKKFYDCKSNILSLEECDFINNYHMEYINIVKMSHSNKKNYFSQFNSLKVNTSFYIY